MDYVSPVEAQDIDGLRLCVHHGAPGPWAESAKALFRLKGIPFTAVAQAGGSTNDEQVAWIRHRNAPVAVYNDEAPRAHWLEILQLAEHLAPYPALLPEDTEDRIRAIGLSHEICGANGFAWQCRLFMLDAMIAAGGDTLKASPMAVDYGWSEEAVAGAAPKIEATLQLLDRQLEDQRSKGRRYLVGTSMSAVDVYWAYFSQLVAIIPNDRNPIPDGLRQFWGAVEPRLLAPPSSALIDHRYFLFDEHLGLPMDF